MPYQSLVATNTHLVSRPWMESIASSLMYRHKTYLVERRRRSRLCRSSTTISDTTERERCQQHRIWVYKCYGYENVTNLSDSALFRAQKLHPIDISSIHSLYLLHTVDMLSNVSCMASSRPHIDTTIQPHQHIHKCEKDIGSL